MKCKKALIASLLLPIITTVAFADSVLPNLKETQIVPQTPNVAPMMEYVDRPVSHFAGTVPVSVPLCELSIHGVSLPLNLTYRSTGMRPSQEASWVGLGWNFSLNACISRAVKCVDDFLEYPNSNYAGYEEGYYELSSIPYNWTNIDTTSPFIQYRYLTGATATDLTHRTTIQIRDSEPDIFSMSLWNGSTKFVFNKNKEYYSVNPSDTAGIAIFSDMAAGWQLEVMVDNEVPYQPRHYFTVVSRDGIRYEFKKREFAYITSGSASGTNPGSDHFSFSYEAIPYSKYTSSWFLTKITTVTGDTIGFEYQPEYYWAPSQNSTMKYTGMPASYGIHSDNSEYMTGDCIHLDVQPLSNWMQSQFLTYRLKSIKWDYGEIGFYTSFRNDVYHNTSGTRQDYDPEFHCNAVQKLDSIIVYQGRNESKKRVYGFGMEYGYFNDGYNQSYNAYLYKRLRLDRVSNLMTGEHYDFAYQEGTFPSKQSNQVDYWGYYNGKNYGAAPYCLAYDDVAHQVRNGAVKYSDKRYCEIGMLRTVTHPTGGIETFEYELNEFDWHANLDPVATIRDQFELYSFSTMANNSRPSYSDSLVIEEDMTLSVWGEYGPMNTNTTATYRPDSALWKLYREDGFLVYSYSHNQSSPRNNRFVADSIALNLDAGRYFFYAGGVPGDCHHQWYRLGKKAITSASFNEMVPMRGAGLRIASIEGGGKIRTFDYSNGKLLVEPVFSTKKNYWSLEYIMEEDDDLLYSNESDDNASVSEITDDSSAEPDSRSSLPPRIIEVNRSDASYFIQVSESIIPYSTLANGYIVGYEDVSETCGNTNVTYHFKADKEERISPNPYLSTNPVFSNGRLLSKTYKEGNNTLKVESYNWNEKKSAKIRGFNYDVNYGITNYSDFLWFTTDLLSRKTDAELISTDISYLYNNQLLVQSQWQKENGMEYKTKTYYTADVSDLVSRQMTQLNMLLPVRQYQMADNMVVSGARIKYQYYGVPHAYLPSSYDELNIETPIAENLLTENNFVERVTYLTYNAYGKPKEIVRNGTHIVYLWSCMGEYPVAEIVNCTYSAMVSRLGSDPEASLLWSLTPNDSIIRVLQSLNSIPEVQVTTMTYMPLVGITSLTGPTGKTLYFDYENGRLSRKYYKNGDQEETIETYEYVISGH